MAISAGILTLHIKIPGCRSLKEKRGRLKPLIARIQRDFKVSVAEVDHLDAWGDSLIACAVVSNDHKHNQKILQKISNWVDNEWRDVDLVDDQIELF